MKKFSSLSVLFILVLSFFSISIARAQLANSPWPMLGQNLLHTSRSSMILPDEPTILWSWELAGKGVSLSISPNDKLYISGYEMDAKTARFFAIDGLGIKEGFPENAVLWYKLEPAPDEITRFYRHSAIANDGTIYVGTETMPVCKQVSTKIDPSGYSCPLDWARNYLYAYAPDGSLKWRFEVKGGIVAPAIGADGTIYFSNFYDQDLHSYWPYYPPNNPPEHFLYALNPDGTLKWKVSFGATKIPNGPAISSDGTIYISGWADWEYSCAYLGGCNNGPPPDCECNCDPPARTYCPYDSKVFAINPDGTVKWEYLLPFDAFGMVVSGVGAQVYSPILSPDETTIYVPHSDGLIALDTEGYLKWYYFSPEGINSSAVGADGTIYFIERDFGSYSCCINYKNSTCYSFGDYYLTAMYPYGGFKWRKNLTALIYTSSPNFSNIVIDGEGKIYFATQNRIYAFSPYGDELWNSSVPDSGNKMELVIGKGVLYALTNTYNYAWRINLYSIGKRLNLLPASDLHATFQPISSIALDWTLSPSEDVYGYNIYIGSDPENIDYSSVYATVLHPENSFITDSLPIGQHCFGIRAYNINGVEERNTDVVACAEIPLFPPSGLSATVEPISSIALNWIVSPSPAVYGYNIYIGNELDNIDYSSVYATVLHPENSFITDFLPPGQHCFGIRAYDINGVEEKNTNVSACAIIPWQTTCSASARIKVPYSGKKLGGNMVTIMAEIIGDKNLVAEVLFEYLAPGYDEWYQIDVTGCHPNPDFEFPYFIHMNIADENAFPEGDYGLRAVVTDIFGCTDPNPESIMVTIDRNNPDEKETVDKQGKNKKEAKVYQNAPSFVLVADPSCEDRVAAVYLPEGSLNQQAADLTLSFPPCDPVSGGIGECRMVELSNGQEVLENGNQAIVGISYLDENYDGVVDGTNVSADALTLYAQDPTNGQWKALAGTVLKDEKMVVGKTEHFSEFQLGAKAKGISCGLMFSTGQEATDKYGLVLLIIPLALGVLIIKKRKNKRVN